MTRFLSSLSCVSFAGQAITAKGGRYLEAQLQGSKVQAEEGMLVILAAGDRTLFDDCQSAFQAMGKHSFFLGKVGVVNKKKPLIDPSSLLISYR